MKKFLAVILTLVCVIACFTACNSYNPATVPEAVDGIPVKPIEDLKGVEENSFKHFNALDFEGNLITEEIFKGKKLTMINIWGTFCDPCKIELPYLQQLSETHADKGLQVIGIVSDVMAAPNGVYYRESFENAKEIIEYSGVKFLNLLPSDSLDVIKLYEAYTLPETIFVDENGNIISEPYIGSRSYESWAAIADMLLENM